ncbi:unnamed protein product [Acanthoscelides obtectus]|uniref:HTH CENPB-type domain-containing protein n=1 Tax=Acanthoscelides obtectus TaxID=200917 RepID=A0A9P0PH29_ACAOB|nr:unnamed protein product [Acanthoscelides obtectus]CAK1648275.1 Tigger transposable element-derived protein 6 [Acanthoscelides obtectus]
MSNGNRSNHTDKSIMKRKVGKWCTKKQKSATYSEETLQQALKDVRAGESKKSVAQKYGIPRATIQFRLKNKLAGAKRGRRTYLTEEEEAKIVNWILENDRKGFPRRQIDLQLAVKSFLDNHERDNPFTNNFPGIHWYKLFTKRHPQLSERTAEGITSASSVVSENNIRGWFRDIEKYLKEKDLFSILADPSRVFNGDETCFQYNPKLGKVIAPRGKKNVYEVDLFKAKENLTAMFTFSASGITTPPMIIYPNKRLKSAVANVIPDEWAIGLSENGWMKSEIFIDYIQNHLYPHLKQINTRFPIILFVDGHKSHLSLELSEVCTKLEIVLVALYPNCTRIMQPADVANFRPLKSLWKKSVLQWRHENPYCQFGKEHFAPVLETAINGLNKESTINGFRACGLFPWNPDAPDYSKCLGKKTNRAEISERQEQLQSNVSNYEDIWNVFDELLVKRLKNGAISGCCSSDCENFNILLKIYNILERQKKNNTAGAKCIFSQEEINNMPIVLLDEEQPTEVNGDELLMNFTYDDGDMLNQNILTESELETINLSLMGSGIHAEIDNITTEPARQLSDNPLRKSSSSSPEHNGENAHIERFLRVPETPVRKGTRQTERVSFVISSSAYKKNLEEKHKIKEDKEKTKCENKRKRTERAEELAKKKKSKNTVKKKKTAPGGNENGRNLSKAPVLGVEQNHQICSSEKRSPMGVHTTNNITIKKATHIRNLTDLMNESESESHLESNITVSAGLCFSCTNNICKINIGIKCQTCMRMYHLQCLKKRKLYTENFQCHPCTVKCNINKQ